MKDYQKLNSLAEEARDGCTNARDEIFSFFAPMIQECSRKLWYKVRDETSFEHECYQLINRCIKSFDCYVESFYLIVRDWIYKTVHKHTHSRSRDYESLVSVEVLANFDGEGSKSFELVDVLANVEKRLVKKELTKENIDALTGGDEKKRFIIEMWGAGYTNASELATILANRYFAKVSSERKYIQRFKKDCSAALNLTA
jgi:hypothetical protein